MEASPHPSILHQRVKPAGLAAVVEAGFVNGWSRRFRAQDRRSVPMTDEQGQFDVESVFGDGPAASRDRSPDAVLDGVGVEIEFRGGCFVARSGSAGIPVASRAAVRRCRCRWPGRRAPRPPVPGLPACSRRAGPPPPIRDLRLTDADHSLSTLPMRSCAASGYRACTRRCPSCLPDTDGHFVGALRHLLRGAARNRTANRVRTPLRDTHHQQLRDAQGHCASAFDLFTGVQRAGAEQRIRHATLPVGDRVKREPPVRAGRPSGCSLLLCS